MLSLIAALLIADPAADGAVPHPAAVEAPAGFAALDLSACADADGQRQLPREAALGELLARYPITLDVSAFSGAQTSLPQRIADACAGSDCVAPNGSLARLNRSAALMLDQRSDGRFSLAWSGAGPEPVTQAERIAAFFDLSRPGYTLTCLAVPQPPVTAIATAPAPAMASPAKPAAAPPAETRKGFLSQIRVASSDAEAEKDDYTKRNPAQVSYDDNKANSGAIISANAVALFPAVASWGKESVATQGFGDIRPFVGYQRISASDPGSEVNNLDFGVRGKFRFARNDGQEAYVGGLSAAYETDDRFKSQLTRYEASLALPVKAWLKEDLHYDVAAPCVWCQTADLTLVSDYVNVGNAGDKVALTDLPQYARAGIDATWDLRLKRGAGKPSFGLNLQYSAREDLSGEKASADRLTTRAAYYPTEQSHYAFGLEYDSGRDLTSLTPVKRWLVTWGFRN